MSKVNLVSIQKEMKRCGDKIFAISDNLCIILNRMLEEISSQKAMVPANGKLKESR